MNMYLFVKRGVQPEFAITSIAKIIAEFYTKTKSSELITPIICEATEKEFEKIKQMPDTIIDTFKNKEITIGLKPREIYPNHIKFIPLYKGRY